jgi:bacterioferritin-associated ferredoxin
MYICNCNGITEKEVQTAIKSGIQRWDDVHAFYDCEPCCGQCQCEIVEAIVEHDGKHADGGMHGVPAMGAALGMAG